MNVIRLLPLALINNKHVCGTKINYENDLIDVLNSSFDLLRIKGLDSFSPITSQAHGECDARSGNYEIDFKLLVPTEFMNNKKKTMPDVDYSHLSDGFISIKNNENSLNKKAKIEADKLFYTFITAFLTKDKDDLLKITDKKNTLFSAIKNMQVNKNLLIYIPCEFENKIDAIGVISKLLMPLFNIRDDYEKDTFVTYFQNDCFVVLYYKNGQLFKVNSVSKYFVQQFNKYYTLASSIEE